jgi:hypothetical protein
VDYAVEVARVLSGCHPGAAFAFLSRRWGRSDRAESDGRARYKGKAEKALSAVVSPRVTSSVLRASTPCSREGSLLSAIAYRARSIRIAAVVSQPGDSCRACAIWSSQSIVAAACVCA